MLILILFYRSVIFSSILEINEINDLTEVKNTIIQERAKRARSGRSQEYVVKFNGSESAFFSFESMEWSRFQARYL